VIPPSKEGRDPLGCDGPCLVNEVHLVDRHLGWVDNSRDQGTCVHRVRDELRIFLAPVGQTYPECLDVLGNPCNRPVWATFIVPTSVPTDLLAGPQRTLPVTPPGHVPVSCDDPQGRHRVGPAAGFDDQFPIVSFSGTAFSKSAHTARLPTLTTDLTDSGRVGRSPAVRQSRAVARSAAESGGRPQCGMRGRISDLRSMLADCWHERACDRRDRLFAAPRPGVSLLVDGPLWCVRHPLWSSGVLSA